MSTINGKLLFRYPKVTDGANIWNLVKKSGKLDVNSPYFYLTMCHWFSKSSMIVEHIEENCLVGAVIGFMQPQKQEKLFIWQIAIEDEYRGKGIALQLLDELARQTNCHYIEATIAPSNASSKRLFEKLASNNEVAIVKREGFETEFFPNEAHEKEDLYIIGPLRK